MKMRKIALLTLILMLLASASVFAQSRTRRAPTVKGGATKPAPTKAKPTVKNNNSDELPLPDGPPPPPPPSKASQEE
jgi:hypothetical protein